MDINDLRSLFTVVTFAVFMAIVFWAWSGRRHGEFRDAAHLPFDDEHPAPVPTACDRSKHN